MLRSGEFEDWCEACCIAAGKAADENSDDWGAVRALIAVATHGKPEELSSLDKEVKAMIGGDSD